MIKVGDTVRFLNSVGGGIVRRIEGQIAYVDEDGFETPVMIRECVVVTPGAGIVPPSYPKFGKDKKEAPTPTPESTVPPKSALPPQDSWVETKEGELLNIVLAYEADNLKQLSHTAYAAYLVNDSNFTLFATYLTRGNEDAGWTTRWAGKVEPGMQEFLCDVQKDQLPHMDRIALQYLAFKPGKEFDLKTVACVEYKLDTTKFFKLHCFQQNTYFDDPVIALTIVRNDLPYRQLEISSQELERQMRNKVNSDHPKPQPQNKPKKLPSEPLVVDLHIHELVDNTAGMSNADMLNLQIDTFRRIMDQNLKNHGMKIIFIHGKGEGVLRNALMKELNYRYKDHQVQDASFREYGFGATQVKIK